MRRVLLVTFDFPPVGGSGVQRVAKFAKYLPHFGWRPVVLTTRYGRGGPRDSTLAEELESVEVYRAHAPDPYRWLRSLMRRLHTRPESRSDRIHGGHLGPLHPAAWLIPDGKVGWLPFGVGWALNHDHRGYQAVLSTLPTPTAAILGSLISRLWRVPHVVDYRDPWSGGYYLPRRPKLLARLESAWEKRILLQASAVSAVPEAANALPKAETPVWVIHNGYDEADFTDTVPKRIDAGFVIAHVGILFRGRDMQPLSAALRILRKRRPRLHQQVHLVQVGRVDDSVARQLQELSHEIRLSQFPSVNHADAISYMSGADLLYLPTSHDHLPGKTYEYLRSGTPLLGLGDRGSQLHCLIEETGGGLVFARDDHDAVARFIEATAVGASPARPADHSRLARYSREACARTMAELLDRVARG
ncbi:MAG: hypothetical protein JSW71_15855 [Gemmatimonadota bacterium]|nr:MAG: hypothetical protein JSW71_15855 [Gemmatimonadota bacterium]